MMKEQFKAAYPDLVRVIRLIRYELDVMLAHWRGRLSPRQRRMLRTLRRSRGLKLNIASGRTGEPSWINVDVSAAADIRTDIRRPLPLPPGSVAMIFCEHFCDHLNFPHEISRFLSECHRVLENGGRARFVLHDAVDLMRACIEHDARYFEIAQQVSPTMMEATNFLFRFNDCHQFLYDFETFERLLLLAGFAKVTRQKYRQSDCPTLVLDVIHPSREVMSMYVEAIK
jgi:predicted SAM-dependent methyltransferase